MTQSVGEQAYPKFTFVSPAGETADRPGVALVRQWLFRQILVTIEDGRIFVGTFICFDKHRNIIVSGCTEYRRLSDASAAEHARSIGLVLIPGKHIRTVCIEENPTLITSQQTPTSLLSMIADVKIT